MTTVYLQLTLVRHGETDANRSKVLQGQKNYSLSEYGREQSRLAGQRLASTETITHIITSDLTRCVETAELIRHKLTNHVEVTMDTRIRERGFGCMEGDPLSELLTAAAMAGVRVAEYTPEGGESIQDVDNRVSSFLSDLFRKYGEMVVSGTVPAREGGLMEPSSSLPQPNWHVLVVSHGGVIHAICEQFKRDYGCQLPHRRPPTPNTALTSFLLVLHRQSCLSAHTLTAHSTQHISN